ncbi:MAG: MCE family protein [Verrucomicrobia bacterium]|nr:MCE family protein [Verrucomicrobiota bacterium]MCH8510983.1 MlaD family protein [Kiritimatiellia bacterium]
MKKNTPLILTLFACFLLLTSGCGSRENTETLTVQFQFDSASDLKPGSRVVYLGTVVGVVPSAPKFTQDGRKVLVTARLDQVPEQLQPLINTHMTAQITRDDLITGGRQLTLHLCHEEMALPIENGAVLDGVNNMIELEAWKIMHSGEGSAFNRLTSLLFHMDRNEIGDAVYVFNVFCFVLAVIVLLATVLDGIHMVVKGGPSRERGSPKTLRLAWKLFATTSLIRILMLLGVVLLVIIGLQPPSFPPYVILPPNPIHLLRWEWRFLLFFFFMLGLRFKWKFFSLPLALIRK